VAWRPALERMHRGQKRTRRWHLVTSVGPMALALVVVAVITFLSDVPLGFKVAVPPMLALALAMTFLTGRVFKRNERRAAALLEQL